MIPAHSTVPKWHATPPAVDGTGRTFGVVSFGCEGGAVAAGWLADIARLSARAWSVASESGAADVHTLLAEQLARSTTGLRLMVAGPEQDVLVVQAQARVAGMIDAELAAHVTATSVRLLYCAHCKATSSVEAAVGSVARCAGCGRGLMIYAHLSRRSGSYLGFLAEAEEHE